MSPPRKAPSLWNGRYEPIEVVGHGGEGEVWKARDTLHDRFVALKVRKAPAKASREALLAEARVLFSVTAHPLLPVAREDFFEGRKYVLVMDWIEGSDLARILAEQGDPGLPVSVVIGWLSQLADALDHLHRQDAPVVHGDVKPSNAILTPDGRVVLVDFGMSSRSDQGSRGGTPRFRAPELLTGAAPTPATDVFGLAVTAIALLTGRPFAGKPDWEGIPASTAVALERAIGKALSVDPERRPSKASQLVERMKSWAATDLPSGTVTYLVAELADPLPADDERAAALLLARHDNLVAEVTDQHRGRMPVASPALDATVSVFRSSADAIKAGIDIQARSAEGPAAAARRVAVHTGQAVLRSGTYAGDALRAAAELAHLGEPGRVTVSKAAAAVAAGPLPDGAVVAPIPRRPRRNTRLVAGAAVLAAVATAAGIGVVAAGGGRDRNAPPPISITSVSERPILFESTRHGHRQLFALTDTNADPTVLSKDPASALAENAQPELSPDGTRVVFVSERGGAIDIYVMNADGSGTRRLTANPGLDTHPGWSPDGKQIVFVSDRGAGNQISVMDAERGDAAPVRVLAVAPGQSGAPRYSPDGRLVAFHNGPGGDGGDIFVVDSAATNQSPRRLTDDGSGNAAPDWSPDGTTLVFSSRRTGSREIFTMPSAGGAATQVTDLRASAESPRWSPDGTLIVFQSAHQDEAYDLYALVSSARRADVATRLTNTPGVQDLNPTW